MSQVEKLFKNLQFQGSWRSYQQAILDDLDRHISDDKLHIVAAPGAGKTILGLEVLRRLGKPCLILAPTITIKNQWALRLKQSFMQDKSLADETISLNILEPKMITVSTYQGLLAGLCGEQEKRPIVEPDDEESEDSDVPIQKPLSRFNAKKAQGLITILKKANVQILCFDEAHHLRNEWWKALDFVMKELEPRQTLSLTATPPYDVDYGEWQRYESLCGPVDASISIPELVKNGDLCPHQDLLYFAPLHDSEVEAYNKYRQETQSFLSEFLSDKQFVQEVYELEIWTKPNEYMELFFEDPDFYIACASFFKFHGLQIAPNFLKLFDTDQESIPDLSHQQLSILLNGFLFKYRENYPSLELFFAKFQRAASKAGLIYRQSIVIDDNPRIAKVMAHSLGKLDAIVEIVKTEVLTLHQQLRMVILADYIRYDSLNSDKETLGVIPIFKRLNAMNIKDINLCVMTGKIILIPKSIKPHLVELMEQAKLNSDSVSFGALKNYPAYVQVSAKEKAKSKIVFLITELFNQGHIHIMVGTQALLGEGWDAPSINSLILSSTVASYMLSNQMRGRAIRIDKSNPDKISHIWHLANVQTSNFCSILNSSSSVIGDLTQLKRRFRGYQAPELSPPYTIKNGIERCYSKEGKFDRITKKSLHYTREETKTAWKKGLVSKNPMEQPHLKQEVNTDPPKRMNFVDGYAVKLCIATTIAVNVSHMCLSLRMPFLMLPVWLVWAGFMTPSTLRILKSGRPNGYLKQISLVILESLYDMNWIATNPNHIQVDITNNMESNYAVSVEKLDQREQSIFLQALSEFLSPIQNPRYLLVRKNVFSWFFKQVDYHAIPSILATNKTSVMQFRHHWKKRIGSCNIIYTRNVIGHRLLLRARMNAYSSINRKAEQTTRWG